MERFSERLEYVLRTYRDHPMQISDLSKALNYSKSQASKLYQYISGHSEPKLENLTELRKVFPRLSLTWLATGDGEMVEVDVKAILEENERLRKENENLRSRENIFINTLGALGASPKSLGDSISQSVMLNFPEIDMAMNTPKSLMGNA
ncbi:hypothetical protein SAMN04515674_105272 [Pseudarcicella hirudinis]|uniref:Uncharacterized protein n=1 Tax=Pseudarcicella hirudinis TaxID=1079859 RepID=A0A1I5SYH4_9BACT|nr:hypothetical protein [Pseudarcicella hirudinis]SFP75681.1 hypothetical protein SAMN04515674_105272 [Pseudarcicella hirudinis]